MAAACRRREFEPRGIWSYDETQKQSVWTEQTADQSVFDASDTDRFVHRTGGCCRRRAPRAPSKSLAFHSPAAASTSSNSRAACSAQRCSGKDQPRYVSTAALVTNLSVHFKWGRESSRVWVTRLDDATPVADADVEINDYCNGALRWRGRTDRDGIASVDESLGAPHGNDSCAILDRAADGQRAHRRTISVSRCRRGTKASDRTISRCTTAVSGKPTMYHSVLDRPLFRAGETVSMKHFMRRHSRGRRDRRRGRRRRSASSHHSPRQRRARSK